MIRREQTLTFTSNWACAKDATTDFEELVVMDIQLDGHGG